MPLGVPKPPAKFIGSSQTWSSSLSLGLGIKPSLTFDVFPWPICALIFAIKSCGQAGWQKIASSPDVLYYVKYCVYHWFALYVRHERARRNPRTDNQVLPPRRNPSARAAFGHDPFAGRVPG